MFRDGISYRYGFCLWVSLKCSPLPYLQLKIKSSGLAIRTDNTQEYLGVSSVYKSVSSLSLNFKIGNSLQQSMSLSPKHIQ